MRKKHLLMTITVLCTTFGCSTHKAMYQARLDEAKGYALAACIACMNKSIDSLSVINKDYSTGYSCSSAIYRLMKSLKSSNMLIKNV